MKMRRRKFLITSFTFLCLTGLGFLTLLFVGSLKPSARAKNSLITLNISELARGDYLAVNNGHYGPDKDGYGVSLMIYRSRKNQIFAWSIPTRNGLYLMPDITWNKPFYECRDFGPTRVNGQIDESKPVQCHDLGQDQQFWQKVWQWDLSGKNISRQAEDLRLSKGTVRGGFFVY